MSDAGLTLRLLEALARQAADEPSVAGVTPGDEESASTMTSTRVLEAMIAVDFDLPRAIVLSAKAADYRGN